jgi:hypothetical protein
MEGLMRIRRGAALAAAAALAFAGSRADSVRSFAADPPDDNDEVVADTATEFLEGIPDRDSHSGVFLDVIGAGNDSIRSTLNPSLFRITFGKDVTVPKVFVWDGNNAGRWDQSALSSAFPLVDRPPIRDVVTDFDLVTDGAAPPVTVRHGESEVTYSSPPPAPQTADVIFSNAVDGRWEPLFQGPHHPAALLPTGEHRYVLKVQFRADQFTALNAYKVAANGILEIVAGPPPPGVPPDTPQVLSGHIGGVVDGQNLDNVPTVAGNLSVSRDPYPDLLTPDPALQLATSYGPPFANRFDGTIDVRVRLVPPPGVPFDRYLHDVVMLNADLDDRDDATEIDANGVVQPHPPSLGLPADPGGPYTSPRRPAPGQGFLSFDTSGWALPRTLDPASPAPDGAPYLEVYAPNAPPPAPPVRVYTDLSGTIGAGTEGYERMPIPTEGPAGIWLLRFKQVDARNSIFVRSDATIVATAARIEGRVFCDADQDGNDDGGQDHGIPGVDVTVTRTDVAGLAFHATSDADGRWKVEPIPAGTYRVDVDTASALVADRHATSATSVVVPLARDEKRVGVDFGFACGLGGRVFCDADGDGADDQPDETGIGGVVVTLTPVGGGTPYAATTDANGNWDVESVVPATYDVSVDAASPPLSGQPPTTPDVQRVTVAAGGHNPPVSFGFLCASRLSGRVYRDADRDGTDDGGLEAGLAGVTVVATFAGVPGGPVYFATTDAAGSWQSGAVPAGEYDVTVDETQPALAGLEPVNPDPMERSTSVAAGQSVDDLDFGLGLTGTAALGGRVYCDADRDGTDDGGVDEGIPGVQVVAVFAGIVGGPRYVAVTGPGGSWSLLGVAAGALDVTVDVAQPPLAGMTPVEPTPPARTATATEGQTTGGLDFGFGLTGAQSLSGRVYVDADRDGTDDGGADAGIPTVAVRATHSGGATFATRTGGLGAYRFEGIPPGPYTLSVDPAQAPLTGRAPVNPPTATLSPVVPPGAHVSDQDLGFGLALGTSSLAGRVYADQNRDGDDEGDADPGIPGVVVQLAAIGSPPLTLFLSVGPDGGWAIAGLSAGSYDLFVQPHQPGLDGLYLPVNPGDGHLEVTVGPGQSVHDLDHGFAEIGSSSLSGRVYHDADRDGTDDAGADAGVPGVAVTATHSGGLVLSRTSGPDGSYEFDPVPAGSWTVSVDPTQPGLAGMDPESPDPPSLATSVGEGAGAEDLDFGFGLSGAQSLSGRVYFDADKDATDDGGLDLGLEGVVVRATRTGGETFVTATSATGAYAFVGIPAGTYAVAVGQPQPALAGLGPVAPPDASRTAFVPPGVHVPDQDFGFGLSSGTGTLSGRVYHDRNLDGDDEGGTDPGIAGVFVLVTRIDVPGGASRLVPVGPDGAWALVGLTPGRYEAFVDPAQPGVDGRSPVEPPSARRAVVLAGGGTATGLDFGFGDRDAASMSGRVYVDADRDGTDDGGADAGIAGVVVSVTRAPVPGDPPFSETTVTDASGAWNLVGLTPGTYAIALDPTQPALAGQAAFSPAPPTREAALLPGSHVPGLDFGFVTAPDDACDCAGDSIRSVCFSTELWVGSPRPAYDVGLELRAGCDGGKGKKSKAPLVDRVVIRWRPGDTGPWRGASGGIEVTGASVADGILTLSFCLTAEGAARFPNGIFEGELSLDAWVPGCDRRAGCARLTCANAAVGTQWPPCPAKDPHCGAPFTVLSVLAGACQEPAPDDCGCVRTAAWWERHHGGAKDAGARVPWPQPCGGDRRLCGRSWLCILESSPRRDAWTALARQWIAATLNRCRGACAPPDVARAIAEAESLLEAACEGCARSAARRAGTLTEVLEAYNRGEGGPARCATKSLPPKARKRP